MRVRPVGVSTGAMPVGLRALERSGYLYVPASYRPAPLAVLMHGAGEDARDGLALLRVHADEAGLILLALDSRGPTWDFIRGGYGAGVAAIDRALEEAFSSVPGVRRSPRGPAHVRARGHGLVQHKAGPKSVAQPVPVPPDADGLTRHR